MELFKVEMLSALQDPEYDNRYQQLRHTLDYDHTDEVSKSHTHFTLNLELLKCRLQVLHSNLSKTNQLIYFLTKM